MNEPTFDSDGYPTDETLDAISSWDGDTLGWFEFTKKAWQWTDFFRIDENDVTAHTGGWSGNESLIKAMQESMLWGVTWSQSNRGGHYKFEIQRNLEERA